MKAILNKRFAEGKYKDDPHNFNNDKFGLNIPSRTSIVGSKVVLEDEDTIKRSTPPVSDSENENINGQYFQKKNAFVRRARQSNIAHEERRVFHLTL